MKWLSDEVIDHLCQVASQPDFSGTKYELIEKIGQGGMATVYLARDKALDREVALKVLSVPTTGVQEQARLLQEAKIIGQLEHPGIVPVHDAGSLPDGRFFYAMKRVRGKRLDQLPLSTELSERLRIFEKIGQAVAFANSHGVIHRDLKPQNVMVGAFGEVLVMDWGVAKIGERHLPASGIAEEVGHDSDNREQTPEIGGPLTSGAEGRLTEDGQIVGTPGYMAPEQSRGERDAIDQQADVFGLGGILYFLLTGKEPNSGCRGEQARQESTYLIPPRRQDPGIPRRLEAVCLKALAPAREIRYGSVSELLDEIVRFQAHLPVRAYPEGLFGKALRLVSKYQIAFALIVAYLTIRIFLLIFFGY